LDFSPSYFSKRIKEMARALDIKAKNRKQLNNANKRGAGEKKEKKLVNVFLRV
jgi:hypothetical protein